MNYKRRKYIVNPGFQGRFVLCFVLAAFAASIFSTVLFNNYARQKLEKLQWSVFLKVASTGEALKPLFIYVNLIAVVFVSVLVAFMGAWIVKKANHTLNRMADSLKRSKGGDFSRSISHRRSDEFRDVATALNIMLNKIRQRFAMIQCEQEKISRLLGELEADLAQGRWSRQKEQYVLKMVHRLLDRISSES